LAEPSLLGHLVLVGLMGSGKTTVGRRLARKLDRPFVDADEELEATTGRSVADWFAVDGEDAFRDAESQVLGALLDRDEPLVIATGGGVVGRAENRARLTSDDLTVVWLQATPELLAYRVSQKAPRAHRPLLAEDPAAVLTRLAAERDPWYAEVADLVIDIDPVHRAGDKPKKQLARLVLDALAEATASHAARHGSA
jgi:shikimate kinase